MRSNRNRQIRRQGFWLAVAILLTGVPIADVRSEIAPSPVSSGPSTARMPAQELSAISRQWLSCQDAHEFPTPEELQECDTRAVAAVNAVLRRSRSNLFLQRLLRDMFEPLVFAQTGGEDALAARVTVSSAYAEFAQRRAAILVGAPSASSARANAAGGPFDQLHNRRIRLSFATRWAAIRNSDCAAYPVQRCAQKLDAAMREMISGVLTND